MHSSNLDIFDPFKILQTFADNTLASSKAPSLPFMDMFNYFHNLHQLNMTLLCKYINNDEKKLFGMSQNNIDWPNNDVFNNAFFNIALKYQTDSFIRYASNMFNMNWPANAFHSNKS